MTYQTTAPLRRLTMDSSLRHANWLVEQLNRGELVIDQPYQRGHVWTEDQQRALIRSLLSGLPVPTLIVNDRHRSDWTDLDTYNPAGADGRGSYAVIDGKQRLRALQRWYADDLPIPASWIDAEHIDHTEDTSDGPYVRFSGLNEVGQRIMRGRVLVGVSETLVGSEREEAEIYLLVNGGGTPQSEADMANAARIAKEGK